METCRSVIDVAGWGQGACDDIRNSVLLRPSKFTSQKAVITYEVHVGGQSYSCCSDRISCVVQLHHCQQATTCTSSLHLHACLK
jgi:hypothetical protein